jgi:hypothetical protein
LRLIKHCSELKHYLRWLPALVAITWSGGSTYGQTNTSTVWSADMESGNISQWTANGGGSIAVTGGAAAGASKDYSHSGTYSLKMTTSSTPGSGATANRWRESQSYPQLSYGLWYYFPRAYTVQNYWNVMEWSSRNTSTGVVDPFFILNVGNRNGAMYFYLYNWQTRKSYSQSLKNIPVGQWTHVQASYACAADGTGQVTIWEDGTKLIDVPGVQTGYANSDCRWAVNSASDSLVPSTATFYVDDAVIGTSGTVAPPPPTQLTITTTTGTGGTVGVPYSTTLAASGGTSPYIWSVASGSLPPGLTMNSSGTISGTPSSSGVFAASFQVKDSAATPQTVTSSALSMNIASAPTGTVIWSANMETGDKSQWTNPSGGGEFDDGAATVTASQDVAHTGTWSMKSALASPGATRMFRWAEPQTHNDLTYSAWYYFPQQYSAPNFWNIWQHKSKTSTSNDPFFVLNVGNRGDGTMYLYLYNWQTRQNFTQTLKNVPVGQWFNITARYACAGDNTGHVTFWQDGTQLFDLANVQTRYPNGDCQWSIDNYSDSLSPSPTTIYNDDMQIIVK